MTMELGDLAASILERSGSGEHLEVYVARGRDAEVRVYEGAVESLTAATSAGVGIRVLTESPDGMREGFAWAGSLDAGVITDTLAAARDNARFATPDPHVALATPDGVAVADVVTYDPSISSVSTEEKIAFVTELERLVRQHPKVKGISSSDYSDGEVEMALASTNGIAVSSRHRWSILRSARTRGDRSGCRAPGGVAPRSNQANVSPLHRRARPPRRGAVAVHRRRCPVG